jgi:putative chitinase
MITSAQWLKVLCYCGVQFTKAVDWAKVFEARVQPEYFSLGVRELDDFVGQILHETQMLEHLAENLNYSAKRIREIGNASPAGSRWRSLVPLADSLAFKPREFANAVYGGRLGNIEPDDGFKFAGGGIPMVTGRANYALLQQLTGLPLLEHPELLREPDGAMRCGILWWEKRVPDSAIDSVERVTKAVQGAQLGLVDRAALTAKAGRALAEIDRA